MLQSSLSVFVRGTSMIKWVFKPPVADAQASISRLVMWSTIARRGGLLALENTISELDDLFERRGLQMLVDGAEPGMLKDTMELEISSQEQNQRQAAKVWEAAGGYAPTIGILGAVMGLIHVMENLSDPSKLGAGIAVAFVATIYGVGSANLFFLPIANKLKSIIGEPAILQEMFVEGLVGIANGDNPRVLEMRLQAFLAN
jgi:chemotaxis protein MotA